MGGLLGPSEADVGSSDDEWFGICAFWEVKSAVCVFDLVCVVNRSPVLVRYANSVLDGYEELLV